MSQRVRCWIAAFCIALVALPSAAQEARKFGVLSLVGDSFLIVNHVAATGTDAAIDRRTVLYLPEHAFDNIVAADLQDAIRRAMPRAGVVKLGGARDLYPHEGESLEDPRPILVRVQPTIAAAGVTHLVLLTKLRSRADVPHAGKDSEQTLDGLGFYVDPSAPTGNREAPETGFLAPFAYFRVWLVDVAQQKVLGYREVTEMSPVTGAKSSTGQVWASLSSTEKVQMMHSLVQQGAQGAVRELLGNLPD